MLKSELVNLLYEELRKTQIEFYDVRQGVDIILDSFDRALASGERIEIRGFGSFQLHHLDARLARNPRTGQSVSVPERHTPHFRPSQQLRERINLHFS